MKTLKGIIYIHADPDKTSRSVDFLELAKMYQDRGMRGMVLMNLARKYAPSLEIFGGSC